MSDQPWARVRNPVAIPDPCTGAALMVMDQQVFAELIRSNLLPRGQDPASRRLWERLWLELRTQALSDRTYDVLEDFLNRTETAMNSGTLDRAQHERAAKFCTQLDGAWDRIGRDRALAWAGAAGNLNPARARIVVGRLVGAIAAHRNAVTRSGRPTPEDQALWQVLGEVGLDPKDYA